MLKFYLFAFLILASLGVGGYFFVFYEDNPDSQESSEEKAAEVGNVENQAENKDTNNEAEKGNQGSKNSTIYLPIPESFLINISHLGKNFTIQIRLVIVVNSVDDENTILNNMPAVYSKISNHLLLLSSDVDLFLSVSKRDLLISLLLQDLQSFLQDSSFGEKIYLEKLMISSYIMQ